MLPTIPILEQPHIAPIQLVIKEEKKEPKKHIVQKGDTLTSISSHFNVPISRLWAANPQLTSPDLIEPEMALLVPENTDVLENREMPSTIQSGTIPISQTHTAKSPADAGGFSNTYAIGFCTHYAKQRRPDIPNNLGNADTWYIRYTGSKGSTPQAGAIGVAKSYMHVVYVESVNPDGTVNISEQNYQGWGVVSSRVAPVSEFLYLY